MKLAINGRLTLCIALVIGLLISSCKKNSGSSADSGSNDEGTFSVVMGGKTIGGTSKDNSAIVIISADSVGPNTLLSDVFITMQAAGDTIGFHIPDRTGTTGIGAMDSPAQYYGVFTVPSDVYLFDSVTVSITTETSNRIKGTFAGHLSTTLLATQGDQADITAGTFDLPLLR